MGRQTTRKPVQAQSVLLANRHQTTPMAKQLRSPPTGIFWLFSYYVIRNDGILRANNRLSLLSNNLITAIAINLGILLIASWILGAYIIRYLHQEKKQLHDKLNQQHTPKTKSSQPAPPSLFPADDLSDLLEDMAKELKEKENRINTLSQLKNNQQTTHDLLYNLNHNNSGTGDITSHLDNLTSDHKQVEDIIQSLEKELKESRLSLTSMKEEAKIGEGHLARIAGLEKTERRMRNENKKLLKLQTHQQEDIDKKQQKINRLRKENDRLKRTVKSLATASNEQLAVIKKLHIEVERATKLEEHQRHLIDDLEQRLNQEKSNENNTEKTTQMEQELSELQETLTRTLIEKEFIEEHMLKMDDSLEKAKETEAALARARKEIETLEKHFPDFEPEIPAEHQDTTPQKGKTNKAPSPKFTTHIPELNSILDDNRLFGSLQEFWMTLDVPPLNLVSSQDITRPSELEEWVYVTIGTKDYSVLVSMSHHLAEIVTRAIFKSGDSEKRDDEQKDATGELSNIITGTLATELNQDFPVSIPQHIEQPQADTLLEQSTLVSEVLVSVQQNPLYAVLIIEPK
ncbi:hypothetical protein AB835_10750 [Candidatus Endobugula sertula]|uniref:Chemotaxis phosphatase CheX-like domain-containing protein n=1 Tax=Candidatus Endobugula sertula TaxID=62101 RepID=A0A1D2QND7_9GAMM|nr:hypothetical protein AB835_10750 [Candidatus Endobugula sertula]